jgi:hypothetical protein
VRDVILLAALVVTFALTMTVHASILAGLVRRRPRWRAAAALLVPVLAPVYAFSEHMRVRAWLWCGALVLYLGALALSLR